MNRISIILSFILVLLISFSISCKKRIFNPSIPNRTEFIEEPIANLSIPSKDAAIKVTPFKFEGTPQGRTYAHVERFFKFNGEYYIIFYRRYIYDTQAGTFAETAPGGNYHLIKIGKDMLYKEVAVNLIQDHPGLYERYTTIAQGNAYVKGDIIYVPIDMNNLDAGYYQSTSANLAKWDTNDDKKLDISGLTQIEVMDTTRITVGKYTYMYTGGGLQFSIDRLEDRMRQLANRYETKMEFKAEDFNNLHMLDIGMDTNGDNKIDYRMNPTNYIDNDVEYAWIGMEVPHQVWIMPFNDGQKDYLIRFVEYCSGMYNIDTLKKERDAAKVKADAALTKAIALVASPNATKEEIAEACYQSIRSNLEYEVRNYFIEKYDAIFKNQTTSITKWTVPNHALTHYVIEIVDIQ